MMSIISSRQQGEKKMKRKCRLLLKSRVAQICLLKQKTTLISYTYVFTSVTISTMSHIGLRSAMFIICQFHLCLLQAF